MEKTLEKKHETNIIETTKQISKYVYILTKREQSIQDAKNSQDYINTKLNQYYPHTEKPKVKVYLDRILDDMEPIFYCKMETNVKDFHNVQNYFRSSPDKYDEQIKGFSQMNEEYGLHFIIEDIFPVSNFAMKKYGKFSEDNLDTIVEVYKIANPIKEVN